MEIEEGDVEAVEVEEEQEEGEKREVYIKVNRLNICTKFAVYITKKG